MTAIKKGRAKQDGIVQAELRKAGLPLGATAQLGKAMSYMGCSDLGRIGGL